MGRSVSVRILNALFGQGKAVSALLALSVPLDDIIAAQLVLRLD
jgi:hypothetical protein